MIPALTAAAAKWGPTAVFLPLVLAGLVTALVLLAQSIARWFEDRNP